MKSETIKSSIYYPKQLHKALKELQESDVKARTMNQIAVDILIESKDIKTIIGRTHKK